MPRHKYAIPRRRVEVQIPSDLLAKVNLVLLDPVRGTRKHGALSDLVTVKLREWLKEQGVNA